MGRNTKSMETAVFNFNQTFSENQNGLKRAYKAQFGQISLKAKTIHDLQSPMVSGKKDRVIKPLWNQSDNDCLLDTSNVFVLAKIALQYLCVSKSSLSIDIVPVVLSLVKTRPPRPLSLLFFVFFSFKNFVISPDLFSLLTYALKAFYLHSQFFQSYRSNIWYFFWAEFFCH